MSGFDGTQREHIAHIVRLLGGTVTITFSKENTHLICLQDPNAVPNYKQTKATQWGIKIVDWGWIQDMYRAVKHIANQKVITESS